MNKHNLKLPVFPLPVFILPGGITRLRVFEPRYLTLVKVASKEHGFLIILTNNDAEPVQNKWGSWVEIINFDKGVDGVLEIDVKCRALVKIISININNDKLQYANALQIEHWSQKLVANVAYELSESLQHVFESNALLYELYTEKPFQNTSWVIARWIELLPISLSDKIKFFRQHNFEDVKNIVQSIITKHQK